MSVAPDQPNEETTREPAASEQAAPAPEQAAPAPEEAASPAQPEGERRERETGSRSVQAGPPPRGRSYGRPRDRDGGRRDRDRRMRRPRRKVCAFCVDKITRIDYKEYARLREFVSDRGKILKSRMTGTCARHQRMVSRAIKRARQIALLPYVAE